MGQVRVSIMNYSKYEAMEGDGGGWATVWVGANPSFRHHKPHILSKILNCVSNWAECQCTEN